MRIQTLLDPLFRGRTPNLWVQLFRYFVSGASAVIVDASLLALLTELFGEGLLLLWTALSFSVGLLVTYLFSILWVFDSRNLDSRAAEMTVFALIGVVGLGLTEMLMWLFAGRLGLHYLISKGITVVLVFIWNFVAKKTLLFRNKR